jgi:hypothetical protein
MAKASDILKKTGSSLAPSTGLSLGSGSQESLLSRPVATDKDAKHDDRVAAKKMAPGTLGHGAAKAKGGAGGGSSRPKV